MTRILGVFGASGFGREVMPLVRGQASNLSEYERIVFVEQQAGKPVNGYDVIAEDAFLALDAERYFTVAISDPKLRKQVFANAITAGAYHLNVRALSAEVMDAVEIGEGSVLCSHTYIGSNAKIGKGLHLNYFAQVAHDCRIGDFVTLAPRATCNGAVVVEDYAYLGSGCLIRQSRYNEMPLTIGAGAKIGMGAVVTKSVPPGVTVVGNPARQMPGLFSENGRQSTL